MHVVSKRFSAKNDAQNICLKKNVTFDLKSRVAVIYKISFIHKLRNATLAIE